MVVYVHPTTQQLVKPPRMRRSQSLLLKRLLALSGHQNGTRRGSRMHNQAARDNYSANSVYPYKAQLARPRRTCVNCRTTAALRNRLSLACAISPRLFLASLGLCTNAPEKNTTDPGGPQYAGKPLFICTCFLSTSPSSCRASSREVIKFSSRGPRQLGTYGNNSAC